MQYLYNISKKKLGREFTFYMQMNIKVSTSWDYCFSWKWPDISKVPKKGSWYIFAKSVTAAFVFYCDAKHSDILWRSSHVYCYILVSLHSQTRNFLPKDRNTIIRENLCGVGLPSLFSLQGILQQIILCPSNKPKKLVWGLLIQIISPQVLQESTTILHMKVYIVFVMRKIVGHPP